MESLVTYERTVDTGNPDLRICHSRSDRPWGVLIHTTGGVDSRKWLEGGAADAGSAASADALIQRDGHQYIITDAAHYPYHAGKSYVYHAGDYAGDEVSQALIGIELECLDDQAPTYEQIDSLAALLVDYALMWGWRWPLVIYGHYAVARPLGRRSDPVNMDWGSLMGRLYVRCLAANLPGLVEV